MIVDKHITITDDRPVIHPGTVSSNTISVSDGIPIEANPLCDIYNAVREIIADIRVDETDPGSEPFFRMVKVNNGQMSRITNDKWNKEDVIAFPAVLLHFIDVRYLVAQNRIGEGRGVLRVQFVLNNLNNGDDDVELEGFRTFQRINTAINRNKGRYPALSERFQLQYFDQLETFTDGTQPYWIDYEVWFKDYSTIRTKDYVSRYLVIPPFTNHSDQNEEANPNHYENHKAPTFDEASTFKID